MFDPRTDKKLESVVGKTIKIFDASIGSGSGKPFFVLNAIDLETGKTLAIVVNPFERPAGIEWETWLEGKVVHPPVVEQDNSPQTKPTDFISGPRGDGNAGCSN